MGRKRPKYELNLLQQTVAPETCAREGYNPILEMIHAARQCLKLKDGEVPPKGYEKEWDLITVGETRMLVTKKEFRLECAKAVAPYVMPQLKASEHKTKEDKTITWVIKTFGPAPTELSVVKPKELLGGA